MRGVRDKPLIHRDKFQEPQAGSGRALVKIKSAIVINGSSGRRKSAISARFFAKIRQIRTPGFLLKHIRIYQSKGLRKTNDFLRFGRNALISITSDLDMRVRIARRIAVSYCEKV